MGKRRKEKKGTTNLFSSEMDVGVVLRKREGVYRSERGSQQSGENKEI